MGCANRCVRLNDTSRHPAPRSLSYPAAIIGLQGFFPLKGEQAVGVGAIEYPASERRRLAQLCVHSFVTCLSLTLHCRQVARMDVPALPTI